MLVVVVVVDVQKFSTAKLKCSPWATRVIFAFRNSVGALTTRLLALALALALRLGKAPPAKHSRCKALIISRTSQILHRNMLRTWVSHIILL